MTEVNHLIATPSTLHLRRPFGKTIALAAIFIISFVSLGERAVRAEPIQRYLPAPNMGGSNIYFNTKLLLLEDFTAQLKSADCWLVGTSTATFGLDPEATDQAFAETTGRPIHCFNLAVPHMYASVAPQAVLALARQYHPRLVVHALDATSFYRLQPDGILDSPWIQYRLGANNLSGWFIDQSYLVRYWLGFNIQNFSTDAEQVLINFRSDGFAVQPATFTQPTINLDQVPDQQAELFWYQYFGQFVPAEPEGLAQWSRVQQQGTIVVWVELPIHPSASAFFSGGNAEMQGRFERVRQLAQQMNLPFWSTADQPAIPYQAWIDRVHMQRTGAEVFSHWLGERLGKAYQQGELPNLTLSP